MEHWLMDHWPEPHYNQTPNHQAIRRCVRLVGDELPALDEDEGEGEKTEEEMKDAKPPTIEGYTPPFLAENHNELLQQAVKQAEERDKTQICPQGVQLKGPEEGGPAGYPMPPELAGLNGVGLYPLSTLTQYYYYILGFAELKSNNPKKYSELELRYMAIREAQRV